MKLSRRAALVLLCAAPAAAQDTKSGLPYPPQMDGKPEVYKTAGDARLHLWIYSPDGLRPSDRRPAIVFFFGGGWSGGSPKQFEGQCQSLAARGMVAIAADYRVETRHHTTVADAVRDAKSAVRWVRANARRLGIDPDRIAAGGGSSGGHLAACTAVIDGLDEPGENRQVSSRPNALVLFNPVLVLAPSPDAPGVSAPPSLYDRLGAPPEAISPYHHLRPGEPPAIVLHGKSDTTVPYRQAEAFTAKMRALGNRCDLAGYEGQPHGFFNRGEYYDQTLQRADEFLVSLGYLRPR
jgi:acetyl esterase/lipase